MINFELVMDSLDEAYLNALQENFAIYFASNFPSEDDPAKVDGCLQNIEEITKDYEVMRKAIQQQNLQPLRGIGR